MRDLKFRIWDKKWLFGYDYPNLGGFSLFGEVVLMGELNSIPLERLNDIIVMQFTGLKDKNGKDIYEGDILEYKVRSYTPYETSKIVTGVVEWDIMKAGFYITVMHMYPRDQKSSFRGDHINSNMKKVIGNICENKGLLNENT